VLSKLFPAFVVVGVGLAAAWRWQSRRRLSRMRLSGGRKALALYLADRGH
jgi:hypothetical protein